MKHQLHVVATTLILIAGTVLTQESQAAVNTTREGSSCAPREDQALIYFIRPDHRQQRSQAVFLYAEGVFLAVVDNKCYSCAHLKPGKKLLWSNFVNLTAWIHAEPGHTYYYMVDPVTGLSEVVEEGASALIANVKLFRKPDKKELALSERHVRKLYPKVRPSYRERAQYIGAWPRVDLAGYSAFYIEDLKITDRSAIGPKGREATMAKAERMTTDIIEVLDPRIFEEAYRGSPAEATEGSLVVQVEVNKIRAKSYSSPGLSIGPISISASSKTTMVIGFTVQLIDGYSGDLIASFSDKREEPRNWAERNFCNDISFYLARSKVGTPRLLKMPSLHSG